MKGRATIRIFVLALALGLVAFYNNCNSSQPTNPGTNPAMGVNTGNPYKSGLVAQLPEVWLDSNFPYQPPNHKNLTVGPQELFPDCQSAIDAAAGGDEVIIDAGFVCAPITLRNKGNLNYYIVITTSHSAQLPSQGTRISHSDSSNMAIVETDSSSPAISMEPLANKYYISGLEIRLGTSTPSTNLQIIDVGNNLSLGLSQVPHDITFAQDWIHGQPNQEVNAGIWLNGTRISVVDSIIDDIHRTDVPAPAILGWELGGGPFKFVNDEIVSAGSNFRIGGEATLPGLIPSDVEFRQNYLHKDPTWFTSSANGFSSKWMMGPLLFLANAQRFLIGGNILESSYNCTQSVGLAPGFAAVLYPQGVSKTGKGDVGQDWIRVENITFVNNVIHASASGIDIIYQDSSYPEDVAQNLDFQNNVMYDIGGNYGPTQGLVAVSMQSPGPTLFANNTFLNESSANTFTLNVAPGSFISQFSLVDNIFFDQGHGIYDSSLGTGSAPLNNNFPGVNVSSNVFAGQQAAAYSDYPGNFFPTTEAQIGFIGNIGAGINSFLDLGLSSLSQYVGLGANVIQIKGAEGPNFQSSSPTPQ